jgi:hypothetical protein
MFGSFGVQCAAMRKTVLAFAALALLGCQTEPATIVFKPGASLAATTLAVDQCRIASLREIPQALATNVSGGVHHPGTTQCSTVNGFTTCNQIGAVNIPASSSTYDVNGDLRDRYIKRCLASKGFSVSAGPPCAGGAQTRQALADREAGKRPSCTVRID